MGVGGWGYRNVQRFRGGLVFKAHRLCVSLNSRLENEKEEEKVGATGAAPRSASRSERKRVCEKKSECVCERESDWVCVRGVGGTGATPKCRRAAPLTP